MQAYQTSTTARKPRTLYHWLQHEHTQAYREDCERPASSASLKTVARYARLDDTIEGYAIRTPDRRVFFLDGTAVTELTNADISRLTLLGDVSLVEAQQHYDTMRGGVARIATARRQEA
jgi:hypothetical protein